MGDVHVDLMDADDQRRVLAEVTAPAPKPKPRRVTPSMAGEAPKLNVQYLCLKCKSVKWLDAYEGPPTCATGHGRMWMEPVRLMRKSDPTADIDEMRSEKRGLVP